MRRLVCTFVVSKTKDRFAGVEAHFFSTKYEEHAQTFANDIVSWRWSLEVTIFIPLPSLILKLPVVVFIGKARWKHSNDMKHLLYIFRIKKSSVLDICLYLRPL